MPFRKPLFIFGFLVALLAVFPSNASDFLVFQKQGRRSLPKVVVDQTAYLPIIDFLHILDLPYSESVSAGYLQISVGSHQIRVRKDRSQVVVSETPVNLSAPVIVAGNRWLVPPDFVDRALNRVLPEKIGVGSAGDRFSVAGTTLYRMTVKAVASGEGTRITVQFTAPVQAEIRQEESRMLFSFGSAAVDPGREDYTYQDDRVRSIRFESTTAGDQLVIEMAAASLRPRVTHLASQNVYLLEVGAGEASPEGFPAGPARPAETLRDPHRWHHITIDAGHGGEDRGIAIKEGLLEKDAALAIARRVRWALASKLAVEVVLSRSDDQSLALEERVLAANRAQSNLFVSLHIGNSTRSQESVSYAYIAKPAGNLEPAGEGAAGLRGLFIPWEQAQLGSLDWSQRLAECLQDEMNRSLNGGAAISYRSAPLKLLASLSMPAVLLEIGNVRHSEFREKVSDAQFQNLVAATVLAAVEKFRALHERR